MTTDDFTKVVRLGARPFFSGYRWEYNAKGNRVQVPVDRPFSVFCKVEFKDGRLSITGVEGPKRNGDAAGGCGQISMHMDAEYFDGFEFAPGWDITSARRFLTIWDEWHLNDMRSYSPAQKAAGWDKRAQMPMLGYEWTLTREAQEAKDRAKKAALAHLRDGLTFTPEPEEVAAFTRPHSWVQWLHEETPEPRAPQHYERARHLYGPNNGDVKHPERKTLGWLRPEDHPDGLLGAKLEGEAKGYGGQWWREEVPGDVLDWLRSLPDTDKVPAWV